MEWYSVLLLSIAFLVALFATGLPVFLAFLLTGLGWVLVQFGARGFGLLTNSIYSTATSDTIVAVPLFILMGELLFRSGSLERLFDAADAVVGRIRGRQYVLIILISVVLGALSGSSVAVAAMLGATVLPQAMRLNCDPRLTASSILGGASLAPVIPPSIVVIIIGSLVPNASISSLLIAGVGPGLMMAVLLIVYALWKSRGHAEEASAEPADGGRFRRILGALPFVVVILSITGMIIGGIATPTESAATGVLGALGVALIYRRLDRRLVMQSLHSAALISASIIVIVLSAQLFGQLLSLTGATRSMVRAVTELELSPLMLVLVLIAIPLVICMFLDNLAFMMLATPLYQPIVSAYGIEPIWFWTIFAFSLTIGSVSPPFGYTIFALQGAASRTLTLRDVYSSAWPVFGLFALGLALLILFPSIATWIPSLIAR